MSNPNPPVDTSADDRLIAEDLRRQFQERDATKSNAVLPNRERHIAYNERRADRLLQIAISAGLEGKAATASIEAYKTLIKNSDTRTEYDDPAWEALINFLRVKIEGACDALRIPLKSGIVVGVDPVATTHARQYRVPTTNASIVTVGAHLFYLCSVVSKATARSLIYTRKGDEQVICYDPLKVVDKIKSDRDLTRYWMAILLSFAYSDGPHLVPFELHEPHIAPTRFQLLQAMELFVLAHELGHHVPSSARFEGFPVQFGGNEHHNEEIRADVIASTIVNYLGGKPYEVNLFAGSGAAAVLLLSIFDMIGKTRAFLITGNDFVPLSNTHPSTNERFEAIGATVNCMLHESERPFLADTRDCFIKIMEGLWEHLRSELLDVVKRAR